jgi:hypothetical protein
MITRAQDKSVNLDFFSDPRLSWAAKGILAYFEFHSDTTTMEELHKIGQSRKSVRDAFKELQELGYARLLPCPRGPRGQVRGYFWEVKGNG